jgi:hypothetical protein
MDILVGALSYLLVVLFRSKLTFIAVPKGRFGSQDRKGCCY